MPTTVVTIVATVVLVTVVVAINITIAIAVTSSFYRLCIPQCVDISPDRCGCGSRWHVHSGRVD